MAKNGPREVTDPNGLTRLRTRALWALQGLAGASVSKPIALDHGPKGMSQKALAGLTGLAGLASQSVGPVSHSVS